MKTKIAIKYDPDNWKEIKKAVDYLRGKGFKVRQRKGAPDLNNKTWLKWYCETLRFSYSYHAKGCIEIHLPQDWKKFVDLIEAELEPEKTIQIYENGNLKHEIPVEDEPDYKVNDWIKLKSGKIVKINRMECAETDTNISIDEIERHATKDEIIEHLHERSKCYKALYFDIKVKYDELAGKINEAYSKTKQISE
jgi:hypothetical protein